MRLDWIDDLIALLDAGGVAGAATRRNLTQPAFTRRLQFMEEALGVSLVNRATKPSGPSNTLLAEEDRVRRLAAEQRAIIAAMRDAERLGAPQLALVCQHAISLSLGPSFVSLFAAEGAQAVRLRSANKDQCEAALYARDASISITYQIAIEPALALPNYLEQLNLGRDALIPIAGAAHVDDLMWRVHRGQFQLIAYPSDVFLGVAFDRHIAPRFRELGEIVTVAETGFTSAAQHMALAGLGIAWVPSSLAREAIEERKLIDLSDEFGNLELELVAQSLVPRSDQSVDLAWKKLATLGEERTDFTVGMRAP